MDAFTVITGIAAPLPLVNVDTDMILPARHLKGITRTGLGKHAFSTLRYRDDGSPNPDFILNQPGYEKAAILVTGENFGCGSSREHAPWALLDFGIRCLIGLSFADIFFNNCFKNGILPIVVAPDVAKRLSALAAGAPDRMTIDLPKQTIFAADGTEVAFDVDPFRKHCLVNGLDDIGVTLEQVAAIDKFEAEQRLSQPWLWAKTAP